jgi:O-antigen ligase
MPSNNAAFAGNPRAITFLGNAILLAWLVYLLISPTIGFSWIESWHNEQRAVQIVLLSSTALAYGVLGLVPGKRQDEVRWTLPAALIVFLALGALSALRSKYAYAAIAEVSLAALLATLVLFTARVVAVDVRCYVRWTRWFSLLLAAAYVLGVATRYLAAVNLERAIDLEVLFFGFANPRFASALHAVLIPFLAVTIVEKTESRPVRLAAALVLPFLWAINLGLGTRGIWFAYAVGIPVTALLLGWKRASLPVLAVVLTALIGVAIFFLLFSLAPIVTGTGSALAAPTDNLTRLSSREVLWQLSLQSIVSSPWLGIGPMQFAALDSYVGAHPHNWVLQIGAEWGLFCLGLLLVGFFRLGQSVRRVTETDLGFVAVILAVAVSLALGLVDGNLVMPVSQTASVLVFGLLLGWLGSDMFARTQAWLSGLALALTAFVTVAAGAIVIGFAANTFQEQSAGVSRFRQTHPGAWLVPRFWEQGLLYESRSIKPSDE